MALPPTSAAPPEAPVDMAAEGPPADMPMEGEGGEEVIATICRLPDGTLKLYRGDEPEAGAEMAAEGEAEMDEGEVFEDGPSLMRALMGVLENGAEAEKAFSPPEMPAKPMA